MQYEYSQRRPARDAAISAIEEFLRGEIGPRFPEVQLVPDGHDDAAPGKCGWAFWILDDDTTSYVHEDLEVEWYGTAWEPEETECEHCGKVLGTEYATKAAASAARSGHSKSCSEWPRQ